MTLLTYMKLSANPLSFFLILNQPYKQLLTKLITP